MVNYYYLEGNPSDSQYYWFVNNSNFDSSIWFEYFRIGTPFMRWINYPFAVLLKLPFWVGHFLFSIIGLMAVFQLFKLITLIVGNSSARFNSSIAALWLLLPNLHFWTSGITKEVICLLCIVTVFLQTYLKQWWSWQVVIAAITLALLRPHVLLMLTSGIGAAYLILVPLSRKRKLLYTALLFIMLLIFYLMVCQIIHIDPWDIDRWLLNNHRWRDSFIGSGSYVPIQYYNYPYKLFTFFFRPFFYDVSHPYGWILSIKNLLVFGLLIWSAIRYILKYKMVKWNVTLLSMLLFNIIGALIYIQRYAGLGIFARTRSMFIPFFI
ncbi:hypothetical protein [Nonlabens sp.]|uniref:hypothetical protein n=1 Tax=Nonlabens sp. TaxID=1888209 RepID=UPI003F6A4AF7